MSAKIVERTEWLSNLFHSDSTPPSKQFSPDTTDQQTAASRITTAKKRPSKLVAERLERIIEQIVLAAEEKGGQSKHSPRKQSAVHPIIKIPEGVASDLRKKWQAFVEEQTTAGKTWEQLQQRKQWRKKSVEVTNTIAAYDASTTGGRTNEKFTGEQQEFDAATKTAFFLQQMYERDIVGPEEQDFLASLIDHGEDRMTDTAGSDMDDVSKFINGGDNEFANEDVGFLDRALKRVEQEGVLPKFLADWLVKPICDQTETHNQDLDKLRLDFQPESQKEGDLPQSLSNSETVAPSCRVSRERRTQQEEGTTTRTTSTTELATPTAEPVLVSPISRESFDEVQDRVPPGVTNADSSVIFATRMTHTDSSAKKGLLHQTRLFFLNPESYSVSYRSSISHHHETQTRVGKRKDFLKIKYRDESFSFKDHAVFLEDGALLMSIP